MIVNKVTEATIYEYTDGRETVYVKEHGSERKEIDSQSPRAFDLRAQLMEDQLWGNIRRAAKTNPTLKRALDEAVLIYNLSK
jgi:hypothetical protein